MEIFVDCVQPCWPLKQQLLDLDNNNLMALTLIVFVAVMFCKVLYLIIYPVGYYVTLPLFCLSCYLQLYLMPLSAKDMYVQFGNWVR